MTARHLVLNPVVDILDANTARGGCVGVVRGDAKGLLPVPVVPNVTIDAFIRPLAFTPHADDGPRFDRAAWQ